MEHDSQPEAYYIHVWIRGIHPMLWRRFLLRSDSTLADHALAGSAATTHGKPSWGSCTFASMNASCMTTISAIYGNTSCGSRNDWE
jgi:hypothetical protein